MPNRAFDASQPNISITAVRTALEGFGFTYRPIQPSPLSELYVVDRLVNDLTFPRLSQSRPYALQVVLTDLIRTRFAQQLSVFQLPFPHDEQPYPEALQHLRRCSQVGKSELMGWCWLYYHYVRTDLEISRAVFCTTCHIDLRTLHRYQTASLRRLTQCLAEAEWQARTEARQAWFRSGRL